MHQNPTSRRCGHARRRSTPTPRAMHKQHTESGPSCCVPSGDPHVHNVPPSCNARQERSHSSENTMGPVHHMTRTHHTDDQSKGRKREGYISKGFCANTDLCPLASPRVALVGWPAQAPRQRQHEVRQGDTHDSGFAAIRVSPCQTSNAKSAMAQ